MNHSLRYFVVDAFAAGPYTGNPAGVVLHADALSDAQMRHIAREINLSETAFVSRIGDPHQAMRIRWWTPAREVDFCGHATLGASHAVLVAGVHAAPRSSFRKESGAPGNAEAAARPDPETAPVAGHARVEFEGRCGALRLNFEPVGAAKPAANARQGSPGSGDPDGLWWLTAPDAGLKPDNTNPMLTVQHLGLTMDDLDARVPIMRTRDGDLMMLIRRWDTLVQMRPRFDELARWGDEHGIRGYFITTTQTLDPSAHTHSRFFAPSFGINEDPVTGSAHGALATLLAKYKLLPEVGGRIAANCVQGEPGGRSGLVRVLVDTFEGKQRVQIGGRCCVTMRGELSMPKDE